MKNLFKARIAHIFGIAALVVIIGVSFTSCGEEERPSGTGWPSNDILNDYALPATQPIEASMIDWEVNDRDYLQMLLTWSSSASRNIHGWLEDSGWGKGEEDEDGDFIYRSYPRVLICSTGDGVFGPNRYLLMITK